MLFSIIIPVYNRPDEIDELLSSLVEQTDTDFEVIIVEDGSSIACKTVVEKYAGKLPVAYYLIENSGPGQARNYGAKQASGDYLLILDSDCIIPPAYIASVRNELQETNADAFGGPDRALDSFTPVQKAINYSMTSLFTTGGIRGQKKKIGKFYPRSFNMGIRREVYEKLGGFAKMRFGEDIDFSIRIYNAGYKVALFLSAYVYHKRRNNFKTFFKQVYNSGIARINLYKKYPDSLKIVHLFPSAFLLFLILSLLTAYWCVAGMACISLYTLIIFLDATIQNKSPYVGLLSILASFTQLIGYGSGFLSAFWKRVILGKDEFSAFDKNFYK
ncbi:glycosyltransferase [Dysgonomonas sp. 25]|uniref:glycosyltransferase n=1 Tax=Dysgonomonas sp. 25 TaxID=2302933 RepID=UPI0013D35934|nr:glycosyltransferase [Dysgonomonas sp. 25]NDV68895.1 glycosyltransferase [Dysgonomonas sp. 25]